MLPDFDPAGLVLVEILAMHINPLIVLINEHLTLEVAGLEVLCKHAHGFDLRAPTAEEGKDCFAKDLAEWKGLHPGASSGQWKICK